jgi:hypothetical protein
MAVRAGVIVETRNLVNVNAYAEYIVVGTSINIDSSGAYPGATKFSERHNRDDGHGPRAGGFSKRP